VALELARSGYHVVVNYRSSEAKADETVFSH
jgi:NAD(P)-dependent dehydrogenase (short-subunit alcohol dehydrogenase family)